MVPVRLSCDNGNPVKTSKCTSFTHFTMLSEIPKLVLIVHNIHRGVWQTGWMQTYYNRYPRYSSELGCCKRQVEHPQISDFHVIHALPCYRGKLRPYMGWYCWGCSRSTLDLVRPYQMNYARHNGTWASSIAQREHLQNFETLTLLPPFSQAETAKSGPKVTRM